MPSEGVLCGNCGRMSIQGGKWKHYSKMETIKFLLTPGHSIGHVVCSKCKGENILKHYRRIKRNDKR